MHSIVVIAGGFATLAVLIAIASRIGSDRRSSMARAALVFIPLWLVAALVNMYVGVVIAGYSVADELPFFALVFGAPAVLAFLVRRRVLAGR